MLEFKKFNILLVEDDFEMQNNMSKILSFIFKKVYVTSNGVNALEIIKKNDIHIIITDYEMPFMNGYELVKKIRDENLKIPIIMLSNYTDKNKLINCVPLKLVSYLEKPVIYEELINTLNICINEIKSSSTFDFKIVDNIKYNSKTKSLIKNNKIIKLTDYETSVIEILIKKKNQIVDKNNLINILSKNNFVDEVTLKNVIYRLKKKLTNDLIVNHKNIGYMLISN